MATSGSSSTAAIPIQRAGPTTQHVDRGYASKSVANIHSAMQLSPAPQTVVGATRNAGAPAPAASPGPKPSPPSDDAATHALELRRQFAAARAHRHHKRKRAKGAAAYQAVLKSKAAKAAATAEAQAAAAAAAEEAARQAAKAAAESHPEDRDVEHLRGRRGHGYCCGDPLLRERRQALLASPWWRPISGRPIRGPTPSAHRANARGLRPGVIFAASERSGTCEVDPSAGRLSRFRAR